MNDQTVLDGAVLVGYERGGAAANSQVARTAETGRRGVAGDGAA
jgi:SLT domain-containing protein